MAWMTLHQSVWTHRKTTRAMVALGVSRREAVGILAGLWMWALDNVPENGSLRGLKDEEIAAAVDWPLDDAARLVAGLVSAGYIDRGKRVFCLHNWRSYSEKFHSTRLSARLRKRREREKRENSSAESRVFPDRELEAKSEKVGDLDTNGHAFVTRDSGQTDRSVGQTDRQTTPTDLRARATRDPTPQPPPTDTGEASLSLTDRPITDSGSAGQQGTDGMSSLKAYLRHLGLPVCDSSCPCAGTKDQRCPTMTLTDRQRLDLQTAMQRWSEKRDAQGLRGPPIEPAVSANGVTPETRQAVAELLGYPPAGKRIQAIFGGSVGWADGATDADWREVLRRAEVKGNAAPERNPKDGSVKEGWLRATMRSLRP